MKKMMLSTISALLLVFSLSENANAQSKPPENNASGAIGADEFNCDICLKNTVHHTAMNPPGVKVDGYERALAETGTGTQTLQAPQQGTGKTK